MLCFVVEMDNFSSSFCSEYIYVYICICMLYMEVYGRAHLVSYLFGYKLQYNLCLFLGFY